MREFGAAKTVPQRRKSGERSNSRIAMPTLMLQWMAFRASTSAKTMPPKKANESQNSGMERY
jgi:hypothetical protein